MLGKILLRVACRVSRTREQEAFLNALPKMQFTNDEELIANIRNIYERRVRVELCRSSCKIARDFEMQVSVLKGTC